MENFFIVRWILKCMAFLFKGKRRSHKRVQIQKISGNSTGIQVGGNVQEQLRKDLNNTCSQ